VTDDEPVYLDQHRGMAAQKEIEIRRLMQADQAALRARREQLESVMFSADPTTCRKRPPRRATRSSFIA